MITVPSRRPRPTRGVWLFALVSFLLLALLGAAPSARGAAPSDSSASWPTVKVGTEGVYPPFSFHQGGRLTGYDVDYFREVGRRAHVKVQFVETPWDSMFAGLDSGRIDVIANQVSITDERQAKYALSTPYVRTTGVVVVRDGTKNITKLADLKGKTAAQNVTSDWDQVAKGAGANITSVDGMDKAAALLQQGRVDTFVNDELAVKYYLATHRDSGLKIAFATNDTSQSVFAARKGWNKMPAVDQAIRSMNADGSAKKLYDNYFATKPHAETPWQVIRENIGSMLVATLKVTLPLTVVTFIIGLALALAVALARLSSTAAISWLARAFVSVFRGTPLIVQLFIIFFGLPEVGIRFSPWPSAALALSLNVAAYAAEIIRSAILSVPRGQWEAAETIGMNRATTLKRVILPQAARVAVPPLSNTLISLVKDTSLAATIGVAEMFHESQIAAAPNGDYIELYCTAAAIYWVICFVLSLVQTRLEDRLGRHVAR